MGAPISDERQAAAAAASKTQPDTDLPEPEGAGAPAPALAPASTSEGSHERRRSSRRFSPFSDGEMLIERFRIVEELGRGAMGVVYRAWDERLQRPVALKTLRDEGSDDPVRIERFRREIETLSGLRHPNIVSVHDFGVHEDRFWFVMDRIEGETLGDLIQREPLEPRRAFKLLLPVALALSHAHTSGFIHRDIKPENILLDGSGSPYLTDFGLAVRPAQQTRLTETGQSVGTPAFMAPEQIAGGRQVDERTDIYALGATLYECLTGRAPFADSQTYAELVYAIVHDEPKRPRALRANIALDAESICLRCLEKEPERRYASVSALVADMERFLRGEAVLAHGPTRWRRVARAARRHWSLVAGVLVGAGGIALAGGMALTQRREVERNLRITENLERERENLYRVYQRTIRDEKRREDRDAQLEKLLLTSGDERALEGYSDVLEADPEYWEAYTRRALIRLRQALQREARGEPVAELADAAISELRRGAINDGPSPVLRVLAGEVALLLRGDPLRARPFFLAARSNEPESASPADALARSRLRLLAGDLAGAASALRGEAELEGSLPAQLILAEAELEAGEIESAAARLASLKASLGEPPLRDFDVLYIRELERLELALELRRDPARAEAILRVATQDGRLLWQQLAAEAELAQGLGAAAEARLAPLTEAWPGCGALWDLRARAARALNATEAAARYEGRAAACRQGPPGG